MSTANNNQIVGFTYDAAGEETNDGINSYTYDAEGNIVKVVNSSTTATYTYDTLSHRVQTVVGSVTTDIFFNATGQRDSEWTGQACS